jgi:hypothetical protein
LSLFFMLCIKEIVVFGRKYPFPRPPTCLKEGCGSSRIWGHGYEDLVNEGDEGNLNILVKSLSMVIMTMFSLHAFSYTSSSEIPERPLSLMLRTLFPRDLN